MARPRVFVGSSKEGLKVAPIVAAHLQSDLVPTLWNQGLFRPGHYALEDLDRAVRGSDFAVIVGTPDDVLTKRGKVSRTIRDNLVFELGLFTGLLGRRRSILLVPDGVQLTLPSDLYGLTNATYGPLASAPTTKDSLALLQTASRSLKRNLLLEWGAVISTREADRARLLASRRLDAVRRLHRAVTQLRDLFIEFPTQALAALDDRGRFEGVKQQAGEQVHGMYREWLPDAELLGVTVHLEALALATRAAVEAFPYPAIPFSAVEVVAVGKRLLAESGRRDGDVWERAEAVFGQMGAELERMLTAIAEQYARWWKHHAPELRRLANKLHESLVDSSVAAGQEGIAPHTRVA